MKKTRHPQRFTQIRTRRLYSAVIFILIVIAVLIFYKRSYKSNKVLSKYAFNMNNGNAVLKPFTGEKIVHIDLKGAPPKISYYEKLFPLLSSLGATGLLIEYEDMFPYTGSILQNISAINCYTQSDIKTINKLAKQNNLHITPLVQTFGHLEFLLKLREFHHLREVPEYPQAICPTHSETLKLLTDMLDQVIALHPESKMIHIGADEVYFIAMCERCLNTMAKFTWTKHQLFLEHITAVARQIKQKHNVRVLMWDDQFRVMAKADLKKSQIGTIIEPVVWKYTREVYNDLGPVLWDNYAEVFPKVWIASSFKGATGSDQYVTDAMYHVENHRSWMAVVHEYSGRIKFEGIFLTGWQRYDHFSILCELLPVGIPSLAMNLFLLMGHNQSPLMPPTEIAKILQCEQPYALLGPAFGSPKCLYPGADVLEVVLRYQQLRQDYENIITDSRYKGWISGYNTANCYSNTLHVRTLLASVDVMKEELHLVTLDMTTAMMEVYDNYTIQEWCDTYIKSLEKQVDNLCKAKEKLVNKEYWPRRPLSSSDDSCSDLEF